MANPTTWTGLPASAASVTNTANAEMDRMAPTRWLMALKYSLLSGEEIMGSRAGLFMGASISYSWAESKASRLWMALSPERLATGKSLTTKGTKEGKGIIYRHFPFLSCGVKMIFPPKMAGLKPYTP